MSLADVGPTPRRIGPTSARCRADEQTTSIRRHADVYYRYVADVVLTSARRRRVYWVMAAYRRVYDSRHLQADGQEPGSAPEPYAR